MNKKYKNFSSILLLSKPSQKFAKYSIYVMFE